MIGPRSIGRNQRGFMLLEVLLAVSMLAIGLFAIIDCLGRCLAAVRSVQSYTTADLLLSERSYYFRIEQPTDDLPQNGNFEGYPEFTWDRAFEETEIQGLWKQILTVTWQERGQSMSDSIVEYRYLPNKQR